MGDAHELYDRQQFLINRKECVKYICGIPFYRRKPPISTKCRNKIYRVDGQAVLSPRFGCLRAMRTVNSLVHNSQFCPDPSSFSVWILVTLPGFRISNPSRYVHAHILASYRELLYHCHEDSKITGSGVALLQPPPRCLQLLLYIPPFVRLSSVGVPAKSLRALQQLHLLSCC